MGLVSELRRRNVLRMVVLYVVAAWLVMQVAEVVVTLANLPDWIGPAILGLLAVGFPIALIFSWFYELTSEGLSLEKDIAPGESITNVTGRRMDFIVMSLLSAAVLLFAWHTWWPSAPTDKSIAVLAFENMSDDPEQEYFSDGIAEELLNSLSHIPELRVISRSSSFSFKGKDVDIPTVAKQLDVAHVLEGSVRKMGNQVRITVQLIKASTDSHVWSHTYDRDLDDIFAVQDEIADAVIAGLKVQLLGDTPRAHTTTPEAYSLYLQGKALRAQVNAAAYQQAKAVVLRVLDIDRTYIPALLLLAQIYIEGSTSGAWHPHQAYPEAREVLREVLRSDADNATAHAALSRIAFAYDYDMETARRELELALKLDPHDIFGLQQAAWLASIDGDFDEAVRLTKEIQVLDPISGDPKWALGNFYSAAGRVDEAISAYNEALELLPVGVEIHYRLGSVMLGSGNLDGALAQFNKETRQGFVRAGRAMAFHAMGDIEGASSELEKLLEMGETWTYEIAQVHAYLGNLDESFRWLNRAIDRRDQALLNFTGDGFLDKLHDDPRFDEILERLDRKNP